MSVLIVKVLGFEVLPSFQWSNWYPLFAVAEITAVESVQVGWVTIAAVPMLSSAEVTWTLSNITSIKLEKMPHLELYDD